MPPKRIARARTRLNALPGEWPAGRGLHELMLRSTAQAAVDDAVDERIFRRAKARQS